VVEAVPSGCVVYVRYKDHVLYRNQPNPIEDAAERETVGWLTKQNSELICVEYDRTVQDLSLPFVHYEYGLRIRKTLTQPCARTR